MSKSISDKVVRNTANNPTFSAILEANLSRRTVMRGSLGSALAMFAGVSMSACGGGGDDDNGLKLGIDSLPTSMTDACVVPAGYVASVHPVASGKQLCQHHCPVALVAAEFPELCEAETRVFAQLLDSHVQRLATIAHGDGVCTTHVPRPVKPSP